MTPGERAERAARVCSCKSCRPRLARVVEAEIREAAKPLVEALAGLVPRAEEAIANWHNDGCAKATGECDCFSAAEVEKAREELAKWA